MSLGLSKFTLINFILRQGRLLNVLQLMEHFITFHLKMVNLHLQLLNLLLVETLHVLKIAHACPALPRQQRLRRLRLLRFNLAFEALILFGRVVLVGHEVVINFLWGFRGLVFFDFFSNHSFLLFVFKVDFAVCTGENVVTSVF